MVSDETSLSPWLSNSRTIFDTAWSISSGATGRLRSAICTERSSLSRSNGTRRPLRLITVSSRSCTRSKVVKRKLHAMHTRRRRMTELSSVGRESFTWVSRLAQFGQRIRVPFPASAVVDREPRHQRLDPLAHRALDQRVAFDRLLRQHVEHVGDHLADLLELGDAETARGAGGR